jgi:hypothetical protein
VGDEAREEDLQMCPSLKGNWEKEVWMQVNKMEDKRITMRWRTGDVETIYLSLRQK